MIVLLMFFIRMMIGYFAICVLNFLGTRKLLGNKSLLVLHVNVELGHIITLSFFLVLEIHPTAFSENCLGCKRNGKATRGHSRGKKL